MKTPTVADVAELAGVSYATADRVLNDRGNVAEKSVHKVREAVENLGYVRNVAAANLSRQRVARLAFVLPHRIYPFYQRMHDHLGVVATQLRSAQVEIDVFAFEAFDIDGLNRALGKLSDILGVFQYDGAVVVGLGQATDLPALNKMRSIGKTVVSLVSDLPNGTRDAYIGIDNVKAGRTAARMMGLAHGGQAGRVLLVAGSLQAHDHAERINGFTDVLLRDFPAIEIAQTLETRDQSRTTKTLVRTALAGDDITGVYNVGAGNFGLVGALKNAGTTDAFCIVHELDDDTRKGLEDGVIDVALDQSPEVEVDRALMFLRAVIDGVPMPPMPELIPAIYLRDNLPDAAP